MAVKFQLQGLSSLKDELLRLGAVAGVKSLAKASRKAMVPVRDDAKSMVPVRTGQLRDAIRIKTIKPRTGNVVVSTGLVVRNQKIDGEIEIADGLSVEIRVPNRVSRIWHLVELGTSHSAAHPFLRPAFGRNVGAMTTIVKDELRKNIDKAIKKQLESDT